MPTKKSARKSKSPPGRTHKVRAKRRVKPPPAAATATAKSSDGASGMWKILEMKKAQQKSAEQSRSEGRGHAPQNVLSPFQRNTRFTKFAGPRRKVG